MKQSWAINYAYNVIATIFGLGFLFICSVFIVFILGIFKKEKSISYQIHVEALSPKILPDKILLRSDDINWKLDTLKKEINYGFSYGNQKTKTSVDSKLLMKGFPIEVMIKWTQYFFSWVLSLIALYQLFLILYDMKKRIYESNNYKRLKKAGIAFFLVGLIYLIQPVFYAETLRKDVSIIDFRISFFSSTALIFLLLGFLGLFAARFSKVKLQPIDQ